MKRKIKILSVVLVILAVIALIPYTVFNFMPTKNYDLIITFGVITNVLVVASCLCTVIHSIMTLKENQKNKK